MFGEEWTARTVAATVIGLTILGIAIVGVMQGMTSINENRADTDIRRLSSMLETVDHKPGTVVRLNFVPDYTIELDAGSVTLRRDSISPRQRVINLHSDVSETTIENAGHLCILNDGDALEASQDCELPSGISIESSARPDDTDTSGGDGGTGDGTDSTGDGGAGTGDGTGDGSDEGEMEGAVVIHFSPTSQVENPDERISTYQNGIETHTPFGNECPVEFQTDGDGDEADADIVFTVSHEYSTATGMIISTHSGGGDQATGTLYEGVSSGGSGSQAAGGITFSDAEYGVSAAHETLHEFGMCEEYDESAWNQGENQIYNDVGGCVNPWNRPMYDLVGSQQCSDSPASDVSGQACGSATDGGYSVMGRVIIGDSGTNPQPTGLPQEDIEPLKQFIEDHSGVTCR